MSLQELAAVNARILATEQKLTLTRDNYGEALDTIWMLMAATLVSFMHTGFSMLEAGSVRFKNTQNILAKNLIVVTVGFICWYVVGYSFALGPVEDPNKFTGGTNFVMSGFWDDKKLFRIWLFQGAFCATGGTIVSGAMAERTQLKGFGTFTILMTSFIYPMIVYWGWSGHGFLNYTENGVSKSIVGPAFIDFAGSGIVHMTGGIGSLIGAIAVGARKDRWDVDKEEEFFGHNIPFCVLGTFFLWFGWYGFNPGSTLTMKTSSDAHTAALVAINTTLAPCISGLLVFFLRAQVVYPRCLDVGAFCNGILAGLVSITAGCSVVKPWEACLIGMIGGLLYQCGSMVLPRLKIDDVVDAIPVHGVCGLWGIISVGFFGNPEDGLGGNGVFYGGDQLGTQIFAGVIIILWTAVLSSLIFFPMRRIGWLRMSDQFQEIGADVMEHTPEKAYHTPSNPYGGPSASRSVGVSATGTPSEPYKGPGPTDV